MNDIFTLGINFLHSDTSACIFKGNTLIAAAEEERFSRIKHTSNFPINSINYCLSEAGIDISKIKTISLNSNPLSSLNRKVIYTVKNPKSLKLAFSSLNNLQKKISLRKLIQNIDHKNKFNGNIKYIDHHQSHIASSLFFSNFEECVNVSIDGFGDFASCAWGIYKNGKSKIDNRIYFPHSLGIFYQAITQYLGFKNYGDEYKVMGLSSYGEPKYKEEISKLIFNTKNGFELNLKYFVHHNEKIISENSNGQIIYKNLYSSNLLGLLGEERKKNEEISQKHKDIAKSAQEVYEDIFLKLINKLFDKYKTRNLTLSGGCIMNSVANGKIIKNTPFEKIYISPNPGDAGGSIGSAISTLKNITTKKNIINNYAYLGNKYSADEIEKYIYKNSINKNFVIEKLPFEEIVKKTSYNLLDSKVVGWFQDRMEWGPRALGNRSILADPRNPKIKDIINSKIKRRESFRPFAPSVLWDYAKEWFYLEKEVPYMSEVYFLKEEKRKLLPGITHVDGTGRLQTVKKEDNYKFYQLIHNFYELTSVPIILNTSFNENEPIVRTPQEAIDCFIRTKMDVLVLENWLISRD